MWDLIGESKPIAKAVQDVRSEPRMSGLIGKRINVLDKGWVELLDIMPHPATGVTPCRRFDRCSKDRQLFDCLTSTTTRQPSLVATTFAACAKATSR